MCTFNATSRTISKNLEYNMAISVGKNQRSLMKLGGKPRNEPKRCYRFKLLKHH